LQIRKAAAVDFAQIWPLLAEVFQKGETYPYPPDLSPEEAFDLWLAKPTATYVALKEGQIVGTYYIKPNQPGLGSHVCNAGFIVAGQNTNQGIGRAMCQHALEEAKKLGFKAMQFNLVVSTNEPAVHLWQSCGFQVIGVLPKAFNHLQLGYVDAYVMYQSLE
jgi:ribosomal protein S18 acetylase RimI-like enzyme